MRDMEFVMLTRHPSGDTKWARRYIRLKFRRKTWAEAIHLGIIGLQMIFKAIRLDLFTE